MPGKQNEFVSYVTELMQTIGPVSARKMFSGYGIFLEGFMFGIVVDNILYLKTNSTTEKKFTDRGLEAFKYYKQGKEIRLSYYQAPEEIFDDNEEMNAWANMAYNTAVSESLKKFRNHR